jgi:voltage-gated potassium channel
MSNLRRVVWSLGMLGGVLVLGTLGFVLLTGHPLWECFYATAITITTLGYEDVLGVRASPVTGIYTLVVLFSGMGVLTYVVSAVTAFIVEGDLDQALRRRRMEKRISDMSGHYIVCGIGQTGLHAAVELVATGRQVVAVDRDPESIRRFRLELPEAPHLQADASEDAVLLAAGIERARGLVAALSDDRDNVFVALSARRLAPRVRIVARAVEGRTGPKLRAAGADTVVSPNQIGGMRMASELIRPGTVSFLDTMLRGPGAAVRFEDMLIGQSSDLAGKTLAEANLTAEAQALIVAVRSPGEEKFRYGPPAGTRLVPGMILVILGRSEDVLKMYDRHGLSHPETDGKAG